MIMRKLLIVIGLMLFAGCYETQTNWEAANRWFDQKLAEATPEDVTSKEVTITKKQMYERMMQIER
jgi:uncharacterized lipoprotein YajG